MLLRWVQPQRKAHLSLPANARGWAHGWAATEGWGCQGHAAWGCREKPMRCPEPAPTGHKAGGQATDVPDLRSESSRPHNHTAPMPNLPVPLPGAGPLSEVAAHRGTCGPCHRSTLQHHSRAQQRCGPGPVGEGAHPGGGSSSSAGVSGIDFWSPVLLGCDKLPWKGLHWGVGFSGPDGHLGLDPLCPSGSDQRLVLAWAPRGGSSRRWEPWVN